jgi:trans-aconitate methyltransferase
MKWMNPMSKKKLIIDVGAGNGNFVRKLKQRNPSKEVRGLEREAALKEGVVRDSLGSHFLNMSQEEAERLHAVWINHVDLTALEAHRELKAAVQKIPRRVPLIITVRQERLIPTIYSMEAAGLKVLGKRAVTEKMIMSEYTQKFLAESKNNPDKRPIRIVAVKA